MLRRFAGRLNLGATELRRCQGRTCAPRSERGFHPVTAPPLCGMGQLPSVRRVALTLAETLCENSWSLRCKEGGVALRLRGCGPFRSVFAVSVPPNGCTFTVFVLFSPLPSVMVVHTDAFQRKMIHTTGLLVVHFWLLSFKCSTDLKKAGLISRATISKPSPLTQKTGFIILSHKNQRTFRTILVIV